MRISVMCFFSCFIIPSCTVSQPQSADNAPWFFHWYKDAALQNKVFDDDKGNYVYYDRPRNCVVLLRLETAHLPTRISPSHAEVSIFDETAACTNVTPMPHTFFIVKRNSVRTYSLRTGDASAILDGLNEANSKGVPDILSTLTGFFFTCGRAEVRAAIEEEYRGAHDGGRREQ